MNDPRPFIGYRRRVRITPAAGIVEAALEDDAHRFAVTLTHDGTTILDIATRSPRYPWTTCPDAGVHLERTMRGAPLADAAGIDSQRRHCTHMYDLFILAASHWADGAATVYDIRVADAVDGVKRGAIDRNGATLLRWSLDMDGHGDGDFRALEAWSRTLPAELREAARMLRRGILVAGGRQMPPLDKPTADALPFMAGACYTFQPERMSIATVMDHVRDFSDRPDRLLADDAA